MKALFCGSFDPLTYGHLNLIGRAAALYDRLIVNIGMNKDKIPTFDRQDRIEMIKEAVKSLPRHENITVIADPRMTVDIAMQYRAKTLIRGIRTGTQDLEQEKIWRKLTLIWQKSADIAWKPSFSISPIQS